MPNDSSKPETLQYAGVIRVEEYDEIIQGRMGMRDVNELLKDDAEETIVIPASTAGVNLFFKEP